MAVAQKTLTEIHVHELYMYRTGSIIHVHVRPTFFCILAMRKRGGGRIIELCTYALHVLTPFPLIPSPKWFPLIIARPIIINRCCRAKEDNAFDRIAVSVSKDGRIVGHVLTLCNYYGGI